MSAIFTEEHALIRYLLQNPQEIPNIVKKINVSDFRDKKNSYIFKLLLRTDNNKKINSNNIDPFLKGVSSKSHDSVLKYIDKLLKNTNPHKDLEAIELIKKIKKASFQQHVKDELDQIASLQNAFSLPSEVMDGLLEKTIYNPSKNGLLGLDTGFKELNQDTLGFCKGELIVLGARPGVGKTAFMMNVAIAIASNNKKVAIFSLEMTYEQLYLRCLSQTAEVGIQKIRLGHLDEQEIKKVEASAEKLKKLFLATNDNSACNLKEIKATCQKNKIDIILIDYLQLLPDKPVKKISFQLKAIAKELNIPILCLAQLSRDIEKETKKRKPQLSDLRDTGTIEQDADMVMFLHRNSAKTDIVELLLIKNRNGINNKSYYLKFDANTQKFNELNPQIDKN